MGQYFFQKFIHPILKSSSKLEDVIKDAQTRSKEAEQVCRILEKVLELLKSTNEQSATVLETVNKVILKSLGEVDGLTERISEQHARFKQYPSIFSTFEVRKTWLENKLKEKPTFSWRMPEATVPDHPEVEKFLRSEAATLRYQFKYVYQLRNFVRAYNDTFGGTATRKFTAKMSEQPGKILLITKTRKWFDDQLNEFTAYASQLEHINSFLNLK